MQRKTIVWIFLIVCVICIVGLFAAPKLQLKVAVYPPISPLNQLLPPLTHGNVQGISSQDTSLSDYVADAAVLVYQGEPLASDITLNVENQDTDILLETSQYQIREEEQSRTQVSGENIRQLELVDKNTELVVYEEAMSTSRLIVTVPVDKREDFEIAAQEANLIVTDTPNSSILFVTNANDSDERRLEEIMAEPSMQEFRSGNSSIEPDRVVQFMVTPNDTQFANQWALNTIHASDAWDTTSTSAAVTVAVIDTGIDKAHEDLSANVWTNTDEIATNGIDDDSNGYIDDINGYDFANNDANPHDDHGHGTHVAGIIGAVGNNGVGVVGVTWQVKLMPIKFLDSSGSGFISDAVLAIDYARTNGADILSNSWGGSGFSQSLYDAIARTQAAGELFVAAAGNSGADADSSPVYPAAYDVDNIVSVANTTSSDVLNASSTYGAISVDITAPGTSIISTQLGGGYVSMTGTSMAAPFVSGALALLKNQHPTWTYTQMITQLLDTADVLPALSGKVRSGARLNLVQAVTSVLATPTPTPEPTAAPESGGGVGGGGGGGGGGSEEPQPTPNPKTVRKPASKVGILKTNPAFIANKNVPVVVAQEFVSIFGRKPTAQESLYWKNRARTDKRTISALHGAMQFQKAKGQTMPIVIKKKI